MKRYDEYKQTGTTWIGEIPSHWEVKRLRFICSYKKGKNPRCLTFDKEDGMMPYLSMEYLRGSESNIQYTKLEDGLVEVSKNDMLLLWDGSNAGEFIISRDGVLSSTCAKLMVKELDDLFFKYYCFSIEKYLKDMTNGMGIPHVDSNVLKNILVFIPSLAEQEAIAAYLDKKCGSIDAVISTQERRIALLEELKQSVITEAVTHGINPEAKLRPSGIDWIGNIPEHWKVMPLKRTMRICNGADYKHIEAEDGYPVIGSGGIFAYASDYLFDGEALLLGRKGTIDKPLYFKGKFWTVDTMFYSIPQKFIVCKYMYYQSLNFQFDRYSTSTALPSMTSRDLGNNDVCVPPLREQEEIVEYIDRKIKPIDASIAKAKREIELLRELKQSVITEAVTGKIKVC